MRELTVNAAIAYNQARYLEYANAQCYAGEAAPLCIDGHQDLAGAPLPYASDWMGDVGFTYDRPLGRNHVVVYASGSYQTRYNASKINIPHAEIGGYPLIDAGVHFTAVNDSKGGAPVQLDTKVSRARVRCGSSSTHISESGSD
jgi:iron complex outermembrane receptor protein